MYKRALLALAVLSLGACGQPMDNGSEDGNSKVTAIDACQRPDVLDSVSAQVKHYMADNSPLLDIAAMLDGSAITYDKVNVIGPADDTGSRVFEVSCTASFKLDHSNTTAGQDVVQYPDLAWLIEYAGGTEDLAATNYTVRLDMTSLGNVLVNGRHLPRPEQVQSVSQEMSEDPAANDAGEQQAENATDSRASSDEVDQEKL